MASSGYPATLPAAAQANPGDSGAEVGGEETRLVRELLQAGVPLSRVTQLFQGRVSESELNAVARDIVTQGSAPDPNLGLLVLQRSATAARSPEFLSQHLASLTADAPEELLDPLFWTLMKEPVVLSSGYVVDRSSILDERGRLKFSSCPFTRATLKKDVYPLVDRRRKLQEFKESRLDAMAVTARKMLEEKDFDNFREVIAGAEQFLDDLGEATYIHKARQFADLRLEAVEKHGQEVEPSELAKIYIRIHRTLAVADTSQFTDNVTYFERSARAALDDGNLDQASEWYEAWATVLKACRVGGSTARLRLELARRRGEDLRLPRRVVYRELLRDEAAAQKFLEEEGLSIEDVRDLRPTALLKRSISSSQPDDSWHTALQSPPLECPVEKVVVQAESFRDQGWGNAKSNLGLALYDVEGALVARCNLFGTVRSAGYAYGDAPERTLEHDEEVVARARAGFTYCLEYTVGGGGGHSVRAKQLLCRIFPEGFTDDLITCRLADPEGDQGRYVGPADSEGRPHGLGRLDYDDEEVFVGTFSHGSFSEGVLYRESSVKHTMRSGQWTEAVERTGELRERYPPLIEWLTTDLLRGLRDRPDRDDPDYSDYGTDYSDSDSPDWDYLDRGPRPRRAGSRPEAYITDADDSDGVSEES